MNTFKLDSSIKTIIWDFDGTLFDSFPIHVDVMGQVLKKHGLPVPDEKGMAEHFHGRLSDSLRGLSGINDEAKFDELMDDFLAIDDAYVQDPDRHLHADAASLMQRAQERKITQIVVTNRAHGNNRGFGSPRSVVEHSRVGGCVQVVLCGDEVQYHKPDRRALDSLGIAIDPKASLVVGDQFVDEQFAANLGARCLLVARSRQDEELLRSRLAENHDSYTTIVRSLNDVAL